MVAADEVLCLVLAAGQGRRFGSDKRLARLADGTTLLAASVARAREAFAEVRVVVRAGDTPASLGLPAQQRLVHSLDASLGMGHSLAAGVAAARNSTARAIAVLLGDMPWIAADTLERLAAMATPEAIVFPLYDGQRGHPVLFGRAFWDAACATGRRPGRAPCAAGPSSGLVRGAVRRSGRTPRRGHPGGARLTIFPLSGSRTSDSPRPARPRGTAA